MAVTAAASTSTYAGLVGALASRRRWPKMLAAAGAMAYARTPVARARRAMSDPRERAAATLALPALMGWMDSAKMAGYAAGLVERATGRAHPYS